MNCFNCYFQLSMHAQLECPTCPNRIYKTPVTKEDYPSLFRYLDTKAQILLPSVHIYRQKDKKNKIQLHRLKVETKNRENPSFTANLQAVNMHFTSFLNNELNYVRFPVNFESSCFFERACKSSPDNLSKHTFCKRFLIKQILQKKIMNN